MAEASPSIKRNRSAQDHPSKRGKQQHQTFTQGNNDNEMSNWHLAPEYAPKNPKNSAKKKIQNLNITSLIIHLLELRNEKLP